MLRLLNNIKGTLNLGHVGAGIQRSPWLDLEAELGSDLGCR